VIPVRGAEMRSTNQAKTLAILAAETGLSRLVASPISLLGIPVAEKSTRQEICITVPASRSFVVTPRPNEPAAGSRPRFATPKKGSAPPQNLPVFRVNLGQFHQCPSRGLLVLASPAAYPWST
jgi:hypothetical protein